MSYSSMFMSFFEEDLQVIYNINANQAANKSHVASASN